MKLNLDNFFFVSTLPLSYREMEKLISSQMSLLKQIENLSVEYKTLTPLPRDKFTVEQYLKRLEDYFYIFRK